MAARSLNALYIDALQAPVASASPRMFMGPFSSASSTAIWTHLSRPSGNFPVARYCHPTPSSKRDSRHPNLMRSRLAALTDFRVVPNLSAISDGLAQSDHART